MVVHLHFIFFFLGVDLFAVIHIDRQVVMLVVHCSAFDMRGRACLWLGVEGLLGSLLRGFIFLIVKVVF